MKLQHIIGADLSKESIDLVGYQSESHLKIENSSVGFRKLLKWLKTEKINRSTVMIVMEYTGLYSYHFENYLHAHQIRFTKVSALAIKRSLGLIRGKNDKIDAKRIARYGFEKKDVLVETVQSNKTIERIQMLHVTRDHLVRQRASLTCSISAHRIVLKESDSIIQLQLKLVREFTKHIKSIEKEISKLIKEQPIINNNYQLLRTVKCVGPVVASAMIIKTANFTKFENARKFACYCGTAPFEHSSGKSIRKKTRVSHLADKGIKTLLDQSAKSAIQHDKELKIFYERRIARGKSKRGTINIIRNKILYRMFAVIKRQTPFVENFLQTA